MTHSLISPSSAHRWLVCAASPTAQQRYPDPGSAAAAEGTEAHELAARLVADAACGRTPERNGDEMHDAGLLYAQDVLTEMRRLSCYVPDVEVPVAAPTIHPDSYGTPDCVLLARDELIIWDFKYGHRQVDAYQNWQLINYAAAFADRLPSVIRLRVVQPRCYTRSNPVDEWVTDPQTLEGHFHRLRNAAIRVHEPNPLTVSGPHCLYCRALHDCPAAQGSAMSALDVMASMNQERLTPGQLGANLRLLRRGKEAIELLLTAIEEQVVAQINDVPGWSLDSSPGRRKWIRGTGEVLAMGDLMGVDLRKGDPITPAQAQKKGIDESVIKAYSSRDTVVKLVESDKTLAARAFKS